MVAVRRCKRELFLHESLGIDSPANGATSDTTVHGTAGLSSYFHFATERPCFHFCRFFLECEQPIINLRTPNLDFVPTYDLKSNDRIGEAIMYFSSDYSLRFC